MKINVLQITDSLNVGGTEVLAVNIANSFIDYEIKSHLCSTREKGFLQNKINKKVEYVFLNKKSTFDLIALYKILKYVKKNNINIIHSHSTSLFFSCGIKLFNPKIKLFWHNHTGSNINLKGAKLILIKFLTNFCNGIINVNEELNLWSKNILNQNKSFKLNNFPFFIDLSKKTTLLGQNNKRIVCLAGLRQEKDHYLLLEAFKIVQNTYPNWTLHLIGKDYNNNYSNGLKKYLKSEKLEGNVFLYGMCSDVKNILDQSTIGVLSSKNEGLPISLLEYGLVNLPVLTTNVGECSNVINNDKAIVSARNSNIFAEYLMRLIENEDLRNEIANSLKNNILKYYSKDIFINNIKKIYLDL